MKLSNASIAEKVSFPLEAESFNELQAELAGRQLDKLDKKLNIAYLEIINGYYEDGQNDKKYESFYEDAARWFEEQGKTKSFLVWQSFLRPLTIGASSRLSEAVSLPDSKSSKGGGTNEKHYGR